MAITELMEIDFVVLMGDNIFVQTINFDEAKWNTEILPELRRFYFDFVAKHIFLYRSKNIL